MAQVNAARWWARRYAEAYANNAKLAAWLSGNP
jgi:hypothetical protein